MAEKQGLFITLEGVEGVGKSTNLQYLQTLLQQEGIDLVVTREPGGTEIAEAIRQILLTPYQEQMTDEAELLLMFAARAQHIAHVIKPALAAGRWVLCDRFTDASYAYQGGGRGVAMEKIAFLENMVQQALRPDLTLLLDAPLEVALKRAKRRQGAPDRIEAEQHAFFERVRAGYLQRANANPSRYCIIDAGKPRETVRRQLRKIMQELLHETIKP